MCVSVCVRVEAVGCCLSAVVRRFQPRGFHRVHRVTVSAVTSGSEQSKQIVFAPSTEPTFVNVPQNNFVEPFVLNPGTWTVVIEAEGILLVSHEIWRELIS